MSGPGSGITVADDVVSEFSRFQAKEVKGRRAIIYKISDDNKQIIIDRVVDKAGDDKDDFENIVSTLEDEEPRYLIFDMKGPPASGDALPSDRIFCLTWISDHAKVKKRMLYSSSLNALKAKLKGVRKVIIINDKGDLTYSKVLEML